MGLKDNLKFLYWYASNTFLKLIGRKPTFTNVAIKDAPKWIRKRVWGRHIESAVKQASENISDLDIKDI